MTTTDVDNWPGDVEGLQGPALMERMQKHAERFATEIVFDHIHTADLSRPPVSPGRRQRRIQLRCTGHRHRRHGEVPGSAVRGEVQGPGRLGLRDLRRLLLPRPGRRGDRRRQHRGRGGACTWPTSRSKVTVVHRRDKFRAEKILQDKLFAKQQAGKVDIIWNHARRRGARRRQRRDRRAPQGHARRHATRDIAGHRHVRRHRHTPNTALFEGQLDMDNGYIKIKSGTGRRRDRDQRPRRVRRRRRCRPGLSPGRDVGRLRLHGGTGCGEVPGQARPRGLAVRLQSKGVDTQNTKVHEEHEEEQLIAPLYFVFFVFFVVQSFAPGCLT